MIARDRALASLMPAARRIPVPAAPRRVARWLAMALVCFVGCSALAPWQQNVSGSGEVIALSPDQRPQVIQATVGGTIERWHVVEGQRVEAGDPLVTLRDNDPQRAARLQSMLDAARSRLDASQAGLSAHEARVEAVEASRRAQLEVARAEIAEARSSLRALREVVDATELRLETASRQQGRLQALASDGLASTRERELGELDATRAAAELRAQQADLEARRTVVERKESSLARVEAAADASLRSARASLESARGSVESARAGVLSAESALAQQAAQRIVAPRGGVVQRIEVPEGNVQIGRGTTLARIVPDGEVRAVALTVDGNDASLITAGRLVRLQFEGWPAVQFSGWPSVAVGTFGGQVAFVDPSDDGQGDFRVVVVADPNDEPWPERRFLRQGTRTKGWILLDRVKLGFELWRQLNGFPPTVDLGETDA